MIRPIGVLVLALVFYLAAQATTLGLFFQLSYLLIGIVLLAVVWSVLHLFGWEFTRETGSQRAAVGEKVRERIDLRNRWFLPRLWLELTDESPLPGRNIGFVAAPGRRRTERWTADSFCLQRGRFQFGPTRLSASDPFGLIRLSRLLPAGGELIVYPHRSAVPPFELPGNAAAGGMIARRNAFQRSPSVAGIRDYVPGDGLSRIHWRSSAHYGRLMVKEFEQDPSADVMIVLDLHTRWYAAAQSPQSVLAAADPRRSTPEQLGDRLSDVDTAERSISIAAGLAETLLGQGLTVGISCRGREQHVLTPDRGPAQLTRILELLAVLEPRSPYALTDALTAAHTRWNSGTTLLVVTAAADAAWLAPLQHLRERGVPAVVCLVDPASYGAGASVQPLLDELSAYRIPLLVARHGQPVVGI